MSSQQNKSDRVSTETLQLVREFFTMLEENTQALRETHILVQDARRTMEANKKKSGN